MRNIAVVNLVQLVNNALSIKKELPSGVKFCAVVKADGYGHGGVEISSALYKIVDCFAVAIVEEGIALRNAGIDKEVLVLVPTRKKDLENAVRYNLSVTVDSFLGLKEVFNESIKQKKQVKIHIAFNTGMNRFGIDDTDELIKTLNFLKGKNQIVLEGFYSHLGEPENDEELKKAVDKFLVAKNLVKSYNSKVTCHISASGGFLKEKFFDMVRIGLLLYGYYPFKCNERVKVRPIMKVYAPVVKRRNLKKGDAVSYGSFRLFNKSDIAIIRYGYADGLPRKNSSLFINNRCMDVTSVKLKGKKSFFTVLDDAEKYAERYQTIPYEILTHACSRAKKIYI